MTRAVVALAVLAGCAPWEALAQPASGRREHALGRELAGDAAPFLAHLWPRGARAWYRPPDAGERDALRVLVPGLLRAARAARELPPELAATAAAAGLRIEVWSVGGERYWALLEQPEARRGAGAYVFRVGAPVREPELIVQAPHVFSDLHTEYLAAWIFFRGPPARRPRALFTNTVHRHRGRPGETREDAVHPADPAHNDDHPFSAATRLAALTLGDLDVVQLHAFGENDDGKRERLDPAVSVIVSGGREAEPPEHARRAAKALRLAFGAGVRLFPEDVQLLGGTTNSQARALSRLAGTRFLHVELSSAARAELLSKASCREAFARALLGLEPEASSGADAN